MATGLQVETIESRPFGENSYVVHRPGRSDALVIDPGLEPNLILDYLRRHRLHLAAILNTHGHADHIAGNAAMKEAFPDAPLIIGRGDADMLTDPFLNLSAMFGPAITSPPADQLLDEGDTLETAGIRFAILLIPGHSPGHILFHHLDQPELIFGGDVLFAGSIGRTDFPGGSYDQLRDGIHRKLFTLPDDTVIYPGHGPATTLGEEKQSNPYVGLHGYGNAP